MANEQRLIDANDMKQKAVPHYFDNCCYAVSVKNIDDAPTVDAVEVVHARWEERYIPNGKYVAWDGSYCSACGNKAAKSHYCPNCGAKMDGGNEDA